VKPAEMFAWLVAALIFIGFLALLWLPVSSIISTNNQSRQEITIRHVDSGLPQAYVSNDPLLFVTLECNWYWTDLIQGGEYIERVVT